MEKIFEDTLEEAEGIQNPKSLLPPPIIQFLGSKFQGQIITSVERKPYGYKVKLNNSLKVTFSYSGRLLNQEYE